ncbi:MAG: hypothetical protein LQ348_005772 [Seirophora lacunosa]|nr:MAG: hypothetical protein LQ348_005772 [Seirophora lacunosa]
MPLPSRPRRAKSSLPELKVTHRSRYTQSSPPKLESCIPVLRRLLDGDKPYQPRRCASPRPYFDDVEFGPWTPSPDDNGDQRRQLALIASNTFEIQSAVDEPYRYIPPGPYVIPGVSASPVLTEEIGWNLLQSKDPWYRFVGEYILANYKPYTEDPDFTKDFGVYLAAAIAKHRGTLAAMRRLHFYGLRFFHLRARLMHTREEWLDALLTFMDPAKRLSVRDKKKLIRLEDELSAEVFMSFPDRLDTAYLVNYACFHRAFTQISEVGQLQLTSLGKRMLVLVVEELREMLDWLKRVEIDIRTLPDSFWIVLRSWGTRGPFKAWRSLLSWRDKLVRMANMMVARAEFLIESRFRGRKTFSFWDPVMGEFCGPP